MKKKGGSDIPIRKNDLEYMKKAIEVASHSRSKDKSDPKVGAIIVGEDGKELDYACRGEINEGDHAEFTLLQKKLRSKDILKGATLYTTLEPCTERNHDKLPCSDWIIRKGIDRVVIGVLDPNQHICGKGYWRLLNHNIKVDLFPSDLALEIIKMNQPFIELHQTKNVYDKTFIDWMKKNKNPTFSQYALIGWGDDLTLQHCPNIRDGWPLSKVIIYKDDSDKFQMPDSYKNAYSSFFNEKYKSYEFNNDGKKYMLTKNPKSFSDADTLELETKLCTYSQTCFYNENIATYTSFRNPLIDNAVRSLKINFPHSLCLHMILITSDNMALITERSGKVHWNPNTWSVSIEEQLKDTDFEDSSELVLRNWIKRTLEEELGLETDAYNIENAKLLSVFLEANGLGISLCEYLELNIDSKTLDSIIEGKPRIDDEFVNWDFLEFTPKNIVNELKNNSYSYHPSSGYRMIFGLLKKYGEKEIKKALSSS